MLFDLFITFAKVGVMTFGGGYAMISMISPSIFYVFSENVLVFGNRENRWGQTCACGVYDRQDGRL